MSWRCCILKWQANGLSWRCEVDLTVWSRIDGVISSWRCRAQVTVWRCVGSVMSSWRCDVELTLWRWADGVELMVCSWQCAVDGVQLTVWSRANGLYMNVSGLSTPFNHVDITLKALFTLLRRDKWSCFCSSVYFGVHTLIIISDSLNRWISRQHHRTLVLLVDGSLAKIKHPGTLD